MIYGLDASLIVALEMSDHPTNPRQFALAPHAGEAAVNHFCEWPFRRRLGRKRLLDTMLAATYYTSGITRIDTLNPADFAAFGCFEMELF
jgi:hypothetical protein